MRIRRLSPAVAAATALLALVPASAAAFKHSSPGGRCRISIDVAPREITAGDPVVIFGRLVCRESAQQANQVVRLYHHLARIPGFTYVQSTTTDAHGFYEFARADGVVETNRSWLVRSHGAQSARKSIEVAAQVTLAGPPEGTQLLTGRANAVTFTGAVTPADAGARVILQRQNAATGSEWRHIDSSVVQPGGSFTIVHRFLVPGDANLRVLVRSEGRNIASTSNVLEYEISQAQNPRLTLIASPDPIAFGQSVTLSGVLAGGASQPVTLLARTARQRGFAAVAEVDTNATGGYSFPPQMPLNSTYYEVAAATSSCVATPLASTPMSKACRPRPLHSAVLYEGVKDVLTAAVSATSVQAGQQLTFTGNVAPTDPGHVVYLERENASGNGFHVVQLGVLDANSNYAITHTVYDAGTKVFRIYVPGGPDNLGAASQPFTIQVTPAPAAALTPEAPSNTSLPPEGQS